MSDTGLTLFPRHLLSATAGPSARDISAGLPGTGRSGCPRPGATASQVMHGERLLASTQKETCFPLFILIAHQLCGVCVCACACVGLNSKRPQPRTNATVAVSPPAACRPAALPPPLTCNAPSPDMAAALAPARQRRPAGPPSESRESPESPGPAAAPPVAWQRRRAGERE